MPNQEARLPQRAGNPILPLSSSQAQEGKGSTGPGPHPLNAINNQNRAPLCMAGDLDLPVLGKAMASWRRGYSRKGMIEARGSVVGMSPERVTPAEGHKGRPRAEACPVSSGAAGLQAAGAGQGEGQFMVDRVRGARRGPLGQYQDLCSAPVEMRSC